MTLKEKVTKTLLEKLEPVIDARVACLQFTEEQEKDKQTLLDVEEKRSKLLAEGEEHTPEYRELRERMQALRKKINGHVEIKIKLSTAYKNNLKRFAGCY